MKVYINDKLHHLDTPRPLSTLVVDLAIDAEGTAIAVNDVVVPKHFWESHTVNAHDKVTIIRATQGG